MVIITTIGVYQIRNKKNGKLYVGSSVQVERRLDRHRSDLEKGRHHCIHLQRAWDKYGSDSFEFQLFRKCRDVKEVRELEQERLNDLGDNLYNTSKIAGGGDLISYHPNKDEIVEKMKQSLVKRYGIMTPEERRKVYASHKNGMTGRTHTDATKRKISEINKGNSYAKGFKRTPEQRARLSEVASQRTGESNHFYGKTHSPETIKKLSEKMKGKLPVNTKAVVIDDVIYPSSSEAARQLGVVTATILNRIKSPKFPTYKFLET